MGFAALEFEVLGFPWDLVPEIWNLPDWRRHYQGRQQAGLSMWIRRRI
jgi:hypothetical protein